MREDLEARILTEAEQTLAARPSGAYGPVWHLMLPDQVSEKLGDYEAVREDLEAMMPGASANGAFAMALVAREQQFASDCARCCLLWQASSAAGCPEVCLSRSLCARAWARMCAWPTVPSGSASLRSVACAGCRVDSASGLLGLWALLFRAGMRPA